jgi:hypothetical protein
VSLPNNRDVYSISAITETLCQQYCSIWRPINHTVHDCALAVCDSESLVAGDIIECDRIHLKDGTYHDTMGVIKYRPGFEWYYMSEQTPEEVIMFTQYDSDVLKSRRPMPGCSVHTAFDVPGPMPAGALPRESVEVRAFVFTHPKQDAVPRPLSKPTISTQHQDNTQFGSNMRRADSAQGSPIESSSPAPVKKSLTPQERFMEDTRLHEIIQLRKENDELRRINAARRVAVETVLDEIRPGERESGLLMLIDALRAERRCSWEAAETWRTMYAEHQMVTGYLVRSFSAFSAHSPP